MTGSIASVLYLVSAVCFIMALRGLSSAKTSLAGNRYGIFGMIVAVATTISQLGMSNYLPVLAMIVLGGLIGAIIAKKIDMTALPQLVAAFHSLVGLAAVFVASAALYDPATFGILSSAGVKALSHSATIDISEYIKEVSLFEMGLGSAIGAITFSGSLVAFAKLQGILKGKPLSFSGQHILNALLGVLIAVGLAAFVFSGSQNLFWIVTAIAFGLGFLLIMPIGGADMPVIVSMLNSYSGWAAAGIGFTLNNHLLIITGALVGASGAILSYIMCKGMNRSLLNVILGGFGSDVGATATSDDGEEKPVKASSAEDAAFLLANSQSVIVVPGYGMAVAQAQHALREVADSLKTQGVGVRYAIHPVAGRMPGHMNVLLAEANIPYEDVLELEDINHDFGTTDVVMVIGANDITNPAAKTDPQSPIYGMPILDVDKANTVLFIKRSMGTGYSGVQNELFFRDNTYMLFGDAKKVCEDILKAMAE